MAAAPRMLVMALVVARGSSAAAAWCANSPSQLCRMFCPEVECPVGSCAMRVGRCCHVTCRSDGGEENHVGGEHETMPDASSLAPNALHNVELAESRLGNLEEEPHKSAQEQDSPADMEKMPASEDKSTSGFLRGSFAGGAQSDLHNVP
mmetsp:Transcript_12432/g.35569  ORF Transcript_12432/g.35569 Transcript_12432/m.35569 type:complete len:149 (+) Transcript_12432:93-539(+)|eukprot:CAMPEP_0170292544 /NCGR_PEP_ID=MMETSP0116_2-20130129/46368_1 /TAXON_ID=400756 /ORGANISM="Durinskia baltica, Strain CSIRO CS-38" /LENGTH=148 /DNA_ID=CAMNT_0010544039 /DNA_START=78 /DNA_END=524 /DNA_ORIENTATION=+